MSLSACLIPNMAEALGLEPRMLLSKSRVLPLHYASMVGTGGLEPPTSTLSELRSTAELRPCGPHWSSARHLPGIWYCYTHQPNVGLTTNQPRPMCVGDCASLSSSL